MQKSLDLWIQIVNYNTKKYTKKCIEDILVDLKDSNITYKIFVLDNDSKDDLSDLEKEYKGENIVFLKSPKNWWFGYGHNRLAKTYDAKYMLLMNPDIEFIEKDTIKRVYDYIEENKKIVKVVGVNNQGSWTHWSKLPFNNFLLRLSISPCLKTDKITEVNRVQWSFLLMEKKVFDTIGWFDENFFLYMEEVDLAFRISNLWYKVIYNPKINIHHHWWVVASKTQHMWKSMAYFTWKRLFKQYQRDAVK